VIDVFFFQCFLIGVEDAVDETAGIVGGIFLGQVHGFVDDDLCRRVRGTHFVHRQAQNRAVDGGEAVEAPVDGVLADQFVQRGGVVRGALKELICKCAGLRRSLGIFPKSRLKFFGELLAHVPLKQHLHGEFA
jgi:hypothetical protein